MKLRYRLFRRSNGIYFVEDRLTSKQESLKTRHRAIAQRLLGARNEAHVQPAINLQIARAYLMAADPLVAQRTWQHAMNELVTTKKGSTQDRWQRAIKDSAFDGIRARPLLETQAEHLLGVLKQGTVSTNVHLRKIHNFCVDMNWLPWPVIPRTRWPKIKYKERRGLTTDEFKKILAGERNPEWLGYYRLLWHVGGSQTDVANLLAQDVDWTQRVISYRRRKTGSVVQLHFGIELEGILNDLPGEGPLFPRLARMTESDRASLFSRRCRLVGVSGISLHSFRYAWAERARSVGYPERFAQEALGHNSRAVHAAHARKALVKIPAPEDYEKAHRT
jgi:integrase